MSSHGRQDPGQARPDRDPIAQQRVDECVRRIEAVVGDDFRLRVANALAQAARRREQHAQLANMEVPAELEPVVREVAKLLDLEERAWHVVREEMVRAMAGKSPRSGRLRKAVRRGERAYDRMSVLRQRVVAFSAEA